MNEVLAALRLDDCADAVMRTAVAFGELLDATVVTLHVRQPGLRTPGRLAREAAVELRETTGRPLDEIVAATKEEHVAALVLGARGHRHDHATPGRTALGVITLVAKPVVVVPPDADPPLRLGRVLVPIEGTDTSSPTLERTLELARRQGIETLVVHVHSPATLPAFADHEPHAREAWDEEFLARTIKTPRERISLVRRLGVPGGEIVTVAREAGVDVIVLAWSQDLGPGHAQVVAETLARSSVPVLLLPMSAAPLAQREPCQPVRR